MFPSCLPLVLAPSLSVTRSKPTEPISLARAPAKYFLEICAGYTTSLSAASIKADLAVLVPLDADSRLEEKAHDLTEPDVVDRVLRLTYGHVRSASPQEHLHAPTRTQMLPKISTRASKAILCSTETLLQFSLPFGPRAAPSCGIVHRSTRQFSGDFVKDLLSNEAMLWLWVDTNQPDIDAHETWLFSTSSQESIPLASQSSHKSHPRMKGTHIKLPSNLCTRFAKLVHPFSVSGLPKTVHTLVGRPGQGPMTRQKR